MVVQEKTECTSLSQCNKERNGLIECLKRAVFHVWIWVVRVPHRIAIALFVEESGLFTETIEGLIAKEAVMESEFTGIVLSVYGMAFLDHQFQFFRADLFGRKDWAGIFFQEGIPFRCSDRQMLLLIKKDAKRRCPEDGLTGMVCRHGFRFPDTVHRQRVFHCEGRTGRRTIVDADDIVAPLLYI